MARYDAIGILRLSTMFSIEELGAVFEDVRGITDGCMSMLSLLCAYNYDVRIVDNLSSLLSHSFYQLIRFVVSSIKALLSANTMSVPSVKSATPEDWHQYLLQNTNPHILEETLLSQDRTNVEKHRIIISIPKNAAKEHTQMRQLESKLENEGHATLAQFIRWKMTTVSPYYIKDQYCRWAQRAVVIDIEARWIVQREAHLQEEANALSKSLILSGDKEKPFLRLESYERDLEDLNRQYWKHVRSHGELEGNLPQGIFARAFLSFREDPDWHLSQPLRNDCARRGGCCARDCSCCEKDRGKARKLWKRGHCTTACMCCVYTQGSREKDIAMQKDIEDFPFDINTLDTPYSYRVYFAYFWGLGVDPCH